jgi:hypothetical protein
MAENKKELSPKEMKDVKGGAVAPPAPTLKEKAPVLDDRMIAEK